MYNHCMVAALLDLHARLMLPSKHEWNFFLPEALTASEGRYDGDKERPRAESDSGG